MQNRCKQQHTTLTVQAAILEKYRDLWTAFIFKLANHFADHEPAPVVMNQ
jgi:hypothetical protein